LLGRVGLIIEHSEYMDQDIEFGPWVQRMRCVDSTVARLKAMLADEPLARHQLFHSPHCGMHQLFQGPQSCADAGVEPDAAANKKPAEASAAI
jgi:hypothetical protein